MREITSISNQLIQYVKKLKDKASRKEYKEFIVEGLNIIKDLPQDVCLSYLFVEKSKFDTFKDVIERFDENIVYLVSDKVMNSISDTTTPCGILCVVKMQKNEFKKGENIVVLDGISDPGNFGTIIRTCVACGIKTILAINSVDYTSTKVVRASMGGIFRVNIIDLKYDELFSYLKDYNLLTLDMNGTSIYDLKKIEKPFALVVGSEAHGVSYELKNKCNTLISLPMIGDIESLNAAVSLSVALYHISFTNGLK